MVLTLRNPATKDSRIAQVRSSLLGSRPPSSQGVTTSATTLIVPTASLAASKFDVLTFATARMRKAVSTLAATSTRLKTAKSTRDQVSSSTTSDRERKIGIAYRMRTILVAASKYGSTMFALPVRRKPVSAKKNTPHQEEADERGGNLGHVEEKRVRYVSHGFELRKLFPVMQWAGWDARANAGSAAGKTA
jgi:hypothetical protein